MTQVMLVMININQIDMAPLGVRDGAPCSLLDALNMYVHENSKRTGICLLDR